MFSGLQHGGQREILDPFSFSQNEFNQFTVVRCYTRLSRFSAVSTCKGWGSRPTLERVTIIYFTLNHNITSTSLTNKVWDVQKYMLNDMVSGNVEAYPTLSLNLKT
jgi:hypothetical protein